MSWARLFKRANSYAEAHARASFDAHADPKIQLEQAIAGMQEQHQDLMGAASQVIAQEKTTRMRLADLTEQEARATASARAAKQQGDLDTARVFATKIASLRDQIATLHNQLPQLEQAAAAARDAVQESAEQLQRKLAEAHAIAAQVDQARMQEQIAASLQQVTDLTRRNDTPSFDEIKQKVTGQFAHAQATAELTAASPEVQQMHAHHAELTSEADAILADLDRTHPAAVTPPPSRPELNAAP